MKNDVDGLNTGKQLPFCKLDVYKSPKDVGSPLKYHIDLLGAKKPHDFFILNISSPGKLICYYGVVYLLFYIIPDESVGTMTRSAFLADTSVNSVYSHHNNKTQLYYLL